MWIFGYGSLIWRPGFAFRRAVVGSVTGYERRLDQGSPDHRGTPQSPGRVVTLVRAPGRACAGVVYQVDDDDSAAVLAELDYRERGGYVRETVDVSLRDDGTTVHAVTWIAATENRWYLGPAPLEEMARTILVARGESGANIEYVLRLAEALRSHGIDDPHVATVAARLTVPA